MQRLAAVAVVLVAVSCTSASDESGSAATSEPLATTLPGAASSSSTPSAPTTSSTTTSQLSPLVLVGIRVPHDEAIFGDGQMASVAASEMGVVAVGVSGLAELHPVVWLSPDGLSWTRLSHDGSVFGDDALMRSVVAYDGGFVAVGSVDSGGDADAAVWVSPDGLSWTRVPHDESVFGGEADQLMVSVAAFDDGLVAVGESSSVFEIDAAVWTSADGLSWIRVLPDESIFDDAVTVDVTAFGGGIAAVGFDVSDGDADAAVWTSSDGVDWERVSHDEVVFGGDGDQIMVSVASFDRGLAAVGFDVSGGDTDAAVWISRDGATWTRVPHDESIFGAGEDGHAEMTSVTAFDVGLVAGGIEQREGDGDAVVWTTSDGLTWERVSDAMIFGGEDSQRIASLAVINGSVVAVGRQASPGGNLDADPDAVVWRLAP